MLQKHTHECWPSICMRCAGTNNKDFPKKSRLPWQLHARLVVLLHHCKYSVTYGWLCMSVFTIAKRHPVSSISMVAEAGIIWSIQALACCKLVTRITNVREAAWIHHAGEPCCEDSVKIAILLKISHIPNHFLMSMLFSELVWFREKCALSPAALSRSYLCNHVNPNELIHRTTVHTGLKYSLCSSTEFCY